MSKEILFINKLLEKTQTGKIEWEQNTYPMKSLANEEQLKGKAYATDFNGKVVRIYPYEYKAYHDYEEYNWADSIRLELINTKGEIEWEFGTDHALKDLYKAIRYRVESIDGFMDSFIKDE